MVTVHCLAYNHEQYIRDCLNGIVMQKTNFRFEAIVHDDVSKDKTAQIIREYAWKFPDIIKPIYETENQYSKNDGSLEQIMNKNSYGKYIAICEGDDYWTDPYKLQKQVDFMEKYHEYGLCYTKAKILKNGQISGDFGTPDTSFEGLLTYSNFPTLTRLYRKSIWDSYYKDVNPYTKGWMMVDYPMAFYFALKSKIKYIEGFTGVYRIVGESASHSSNIDYLIKFYDSADDVRRFYVNNYIANDGKKQMYLNLIKEREIVYKLSLLLNNNLKDDARSLYIQNYNKLCIYNRLKFFLSTKSILLYKLIIYIQMILNYSLKVIKMRFVNLPICV